MTQVSESIRMILSGKGASTQEEIRRGLLKLGMDVNQSTVSRNLKKLGAVKTLQSGVARYELGESPSAIETEILSIESNEALLVIRTRPGAASVVARLIDERRMSEVLGTIAGDDVVFVAPKSIRLLSALKMKLSQIL